MTWQQVTRLRSNSCLSYAPGLPVRGKATTSDGWVMGIAGKKAAGRLLDGRTHDGFPATQDAKEPSDA